MYRLTQIFTSLLAGAPLYLVWICAIGFAASKWQAHPRTSMLICVAAGISIFASLASTVITWILPSLISSVGIGYQAMSYIYGAVGFLHSLVTAAAFATLVYAAYKSRQEFVEA